MKKKNIIENYNSVIEDMVLAIQEAVGDNRIDFGEDGFEDESSNDVQAVDKDNVYLTTLDDEQENESYPLYELSFWDGIRILDIIEKVPT